MAPLASRPIQLDREQQIERPLQLVLQGDRLERQPQQCADDGLNLIVGGQLVLHPLTLRDVTNRGRHVSPPVGLDRAEADLRGELAPVRADPEERGTVGHRTKTRRGGKSLAHPGVLPAKSLRDQQLHGLAEQLCAGMTEDVLRLRIDQHNPSLGIDNHHGVRRGLQHPLASLLSLLAIGDVFHETVVPQEMPAFVLVGYDRVADPAHDAVLPHNPVLERRDPLGAEHAGDVVANQFAVLGMDHVDPQIGIGRVFMRRIAGRGQTALTVLRGHRQPVTDLNGIAIAGDGCQQLQIPLLAAASSVIARLGRIRSFVTSSTLTKRPRSSCTANQVERTQSDSSPLT